MIPQLKVNLCCPPMSSSWSAVVQPYCQASNFCCRWCFFYNCSHTVTPPLGSVWAFHPPGASEFSTFYPTVTIRQRQSSPTWSLILMITWTSPFCTSTASHFCWAFTSFFTTRLLFLIQTTWPPSNFFGAHDLFAQQPRVNNGQQWSTKNINRYQQTQIPVISILAMDHLWNPLRPRSKANARTIAWPPLMWCWFLSPLWCCNYAWTM